MRSKTIVLVAVGLAVFALAPAVSMAGAGCCKKKAATTADAHAEDGGCGGCNGVAKTAKMAEGGCPKSTAKLIELAEGSGCPKTEALAAKAKAGDPEATAALVARYSAGDPTVQTLAANAQNGCAKSTAKLIQMAKDSGCPHRWDLADRAEEGDEQAKAELIAMYAAPTPAADGADH